MWLDNIITYLSEFLLAVSAISSADLNTRLKLAFKIYDTNNNGLIDKKEMQNILNALYDLQGIAKEKRMGSKSAEAMANYFFQRMDKDGSNTLTIDEFVKACNDDIEILSLLLPNRD